MNKEYICCVYKLDQIVWKMPKKEQYSLVLISHNGNTCWDRGREDILFWQLEKYVLKTN